MWPTTSHENKKIYSYSFHFESLAFGNTVFKLESRSKIHDRSFLIDPSKKLIFINDQNNVRSVQLSTINYSHFSIEISYYITYIIIARANPDFRAKIIYLWLTTDFFQNDHRKKSIILSDRSNWFFKSDRLIEKIIIKLCIIRSAPFQKIFLVCKIHLYL